MCKFKICPICHSKTWYDFKIFCDFYDLATSDNFSHRSILLFTMFMKRKNTVFNFVF